jgi:hypothetical protein
MHEVEVVSSDIKFISDFVGSSVEEDTHTHAWEECKFRALGNRVLRRMFGPKREGVAGERRRLRNKFRNLFASPNVIRVVRSSGMRWAEHVAHVG